MHVGDIDVMIDVYVYILSVTMECKKIAILGVFAECHGQGTRQRFFKKNIIFFCRVPRRGTRQSFFICLKKITLPSAPAEALGKVFFIFLNNFFAECPCLGTRQRIFGFF